MEPLKDKELDKLLRQWRAPKAPASLERSVLGEPKPWWSWLWNGSIRVPVPAALAAALVLGAWWLIENAAHPLPPAGEATVSLGEFQPVKQMQVRIVRSAYEEGR